MMETTIERGPESQPFLRTADLSASSQGNEISGSPLLVQILSVARRRKWVLIGNILGFMLLGIIITLLMTPKFTAVTTIEIRREGGNLVSVENAQPRSSAADQEFYETQYGLLKSESLAERVAENLRLYDDAHFFEVSGGPKTWIANGRIAPGVSTRTDRIRVAAGILLSQITVRPRRQSSLIDLQYTNPDPLIAKRVVDAWATGFIQTTLARRYEATSYARTFLEQRLAQLRGRIDASERRLVSYAQQENIVNIPAPSTATGSAGQGGERPLVADSLSALNAQLAEATGDRIRAQARLSTPGSRATDGMQNGALNSLRQQRAELAGNYAKLMAQFEPGYPPAQALQLQIRQMDRAIAQEEDRASSGLTDTYQAATAREASLRRQITTLQAGVLDFRRRSIQYNIYQRDADTNRQLYDALLQRYKEIGVGAGVGVNNISVVDRADLPGGPSSPKLMLNVAVAILAGLAVGLGTALILEQMDQGISDPQDIERELGVPLLGTVPRSEVKDVLEALKDPKSILYEAYLSIRTNLSFTTDHGVPRIIAVTSTRPSEGKSTTSLALATSIARAGKRVLLLDGDLRSPSVHHEFDIPNDRGLSNILSGSANLGDLILSTETEYLSVMPAGPHPPSAAELLANGRLAAVLAELMTTFDHVVVDAPPVMGLADAPIIGSQVEGVVFVVEGHSTHKTMTRVALDRLKSANVHVIGGVLTKFNVQRGFGGYGYGYGYGYGSTGNA